MKILLWHVHGTWTTTLVSGRHDYVVPVLPDRGPDGLGRARTWQWPSSVVEVPSERLRRERPDVVILQRPHEIGLVEKWLGRRPGRDVPAVFVEHNAPQGRINEMRHPLAHRSDIPVVHVTHFNALFWDCGAAPTHVIEHGVLDPGYRYSGELARAVVTINEPVRRRRVTGTDLLERLSTAAPLDVFGIGAQDVGGTDSVPQEHLHAEMGRRRVYLHPFRWTSLGLSLLEAMYLGMPVVALATTEVPEAIPPGAGVLSNRIDVLERALRRLIDEPEEAVLVGKRAREVAQSRYGSERFLKEWDDLLMEVVT